MVEIYELYEFIISLPAEQQNAYRDEWDAMEPIYEEILEDIFNSSINYYLPEKLKEVSIMSGAISTGAFCALENNGGPPEDGIRLTDIKLSDGITTIGDFAFAKCDFLTKVTIPNSVTSIGDLAFAGCSRLTSLTFPESVTSIGMGTFSGCTELTSVTIPNSITSIGREAFWCCSKLTSITIPDSVVEIGSKIFHGCSLTIYCEAKEQPSGWAEDWNASLPVVWGYKAKQ